MPIIRIRVAL